MKPKHLQKLFLVQLKIIIDLSFNYDPQTGDDSALLRSCKRILAISELCRNSTGEFAQRCFTSGRKDRIFFS